jgi:hypothetical protein
MRLIVPALVLVYALAPAPEAHAAGRSFTVTSFDRIRLDGPYSVAVTTGVAPFARASGSPQALDSVAVEVQGRTLVIHPNRSSWGGYAGQPAGPVTIEVGTHELANAWLNGAGSLAIDRAEGLSFGVDVQGAGSVRIGSIETDRLTIGINGAGSATLGGRTAKLTAIVRGPASLDAAALEAKDATVGAEGPSIVRVSATETASVTASGVASVTVAGKPACTVKAMGSATVSGC